VSPAIIDRIVEDPSQLQLGGEKRELTIFFSDIAGFTTISEKLDAKSLVALLNEYLSAVTDIILASGGTVDKYVGDAVVAFWNAPIPVPDHAVRGVQAALQIQEALARLRPKFERDYGVVVRTRIGLHSGPVSVGNFGSTARFNYTVIGDAANLASRLEGANKAFGTEIMVSSRTRDLAPEAAMYRRIGALKVVGKTQGVAVFEPLAQSHHLRDLNRLSQYHHALDLFEGKDFEGAKRAFELLSDDAVARKYCDRISKEMAHMGDSQEEHWDPLWNLTEK
jgi:adenylate cyclase